MAVIGTRRAQDEKSKTKGKRQMKHKNEFGDWLVANFEARHKAKGDLQAARQHALFVGQIGHLARQDFDFDAIAAVMATDKLELRLLDDDVRNCETVRHLIDRFLQKAAELKQQTKGNEGKTKR
jgi:hypothetical protein